MGIGGDLLFSSVARNLYYASGRRPFIAATPV
jgi:hypothetical protein